MVFDKVAQRAMRRTLTDANLPFDRLPRLFARWGQPVVVDNKAGANGALASEFVAKAAPDGNTVSLAREMVKSVEARQSHEMALAIYRATSDVIRASLGRPR